MIYEMKRKNFYSGGSKWPLLKGVPIKRAIFPKFSKIFSEIFVSKNSFFGYILTKKSLFKIHFTKYNK